MTFNEWLKVVDDEVVRLTFGLGIYDLPDIPYHDLYDDGAIPQEAAEEVLAQSGFPLETW